MRWWFHLCPLQHFERNLFMLQGAAASKLKGNFYFLNSLHAQSNKHIFWSSTQSVPDKNWMKVIPYNIYVQEINNMFQ